MRIVLGIVLFVATTALAQQSIKINEPVGRQLSSGSVQSYAIELKAGTTSPACSISTGELTLQFLHQVAHLCGTLLAR